MSSKQLKAFCRKEQYTEAEFRQYFGSDDKYELSGKGIFYFLFGFACVLFISPLIPPKVRSTSRVFPGNLGEYLSEVKNFLLLYILMAVLIGFGIIADSARRKLDKRLGYKLVVTRKITGVILLPKRKLLILDRWIPFILNERRLSFHTVQTGQLIQTFRTGTLKLLRYSIYIG